VPRAGKLVDEFNGGRRPVSSAPGGLAPFWPTGDLAISGELPDEITERIREFVQRHNGFVQRHNGFRPTAQRVLPNAPQTPMTDRRGHPPRRPDRGVRGSDRRHFADFT
jgi:hypothetical protein